MNLLYKIRLLKSYRASSTKILIKFRIDWAWGLGKPFLDIPIYIRHESIVIFYTGIWIKEIDFPGPLHVYTNSILKYGSN